MLSIGTGPRPADRVLPRNEGDLDQGSGAPPSGSAIEGWSSIATRTPSNHRRAPIRLKKLGQTWANDEWWLHYLISNIICRILMRMPCRPNLDHTVILLERLEESKVSIEHVFNILQHLLPCVSFVVWWFGESAVSRICMKLRPLHDWLCGGPVFPFLLCQRWATRTSRPCVRSVPGSFTWRQIFSETGLGWLQVTAPELDLRVINSFCPDFTIVVVCGVSIMFSNKGNHGGSLVCVLSHIMWKSVTILIWITLRAMAFLRPWASAPNGRSSGRTGTELLHT